MGYRELGNKVDSREQFGISFKGIRLERLEVQNIFGNKGDFGNFSGEHGNTDPSGGPQF